MAKPKNSKKTNGNGAAHSVEAAAAAVTTGGTATETAAAELATPKKSARKPSIVKSEVRPNLFPINLEDEIRRLAYLMSERRGFEPGHETEDWLAAEREIRQRYHQQSA